MSRIDEIRQAFILAGYTPVESEQLANVSVTYDDPMQSISATEASEMLIKAIQNYKCEIKDAERVINRLCEIPLINPILVDDLKNLL